MSAWSIITTTARKRFRKGSVKYGKKHPTPKLSRARYDYLAAPKSDCFTLGFAKTDVMPPDVTKKKYWVAGYRAYNPAVGVLDPMTASAVWLDDNSGRGGIFLVSIDNVGMSSYDSDLIKDSMRGELEKMGCRGVFILSTHNHAGIDTLGYWGPLPLTGRDPEFMAILHEGVRAVMRQAYEGRREGDLYHGTIDAPPVIRDTRPPVVWNNTLTRFRFVPKDGSAETWLINFASHSEAMLGKNSLISADFPCYLRREIQETAGAEVIYFIGAIGGMIRPKELDEDNIKSTISCGKQLGRAATQIDNDRKLPPLLNFVTQPYFAEAENLMLLLAVNLGIIKNKKRVTYGDGDLGYAIQTEMTYMNLGGQQMLLLPCELFPELAYGGFLSAEESATGQGPEINPTPLTEIIGDEKLLVFGLCNDMTGYVVPPNDWILNAEKPYIDGGKDATGRNHYEETNSLGPRTAEIIAGTFAQLVETVRAAEQNQAG
ncbi:MAG: hypothetical protein LBJ11_05315 [Oscillospiraceae bacterium]|jgi:hypothetical protein|nr:hypothetical protein [Oscillospiraceae bacterium]